MKESRGKASQPLSGLVVAVRPKEVSSSKSGWCHNLHHVITGNHAWHMNKSVASDLLPIVRQPGNCSQPPSCRTFNSRLAISVPVLFRQLIGYPRRGALSPAIYLDLAFQLALLSHHLLLQRLLGVIRSGSGKMLILSIHSLPTPALARIL